MAKKLELYKADKGVLPTSTTHLTTAGIKLSKGSYADRNNVYYQTDSLGRWYIVGVVSKTDTGYFLKNGQLVDAGAGGNVNSAKTSDALKAMVTELGSDGSAISVVGSPGYDQDTHTWYSWVQ